MADEWESLGAESGRMKSGFLQLRTPERGGVMGKLSVFGVGTWTKMWVMVEDGGAPSGSPSPPPASDGGETEGESGSGGAGGSLAGTFALAKKPNAPLVEQVVLDKITKIALCRSSAIVGGSGPANLGARPHVFSVYVGHESPLHLDAGSEDHLLEWMAFFESILPADVVLTYRDALPGGGEGGEEAGEAGEAGEDAASSSASMSSSALSLSGSASEIGIAYRREPSGAVGGMLDKKGEGLIGLWKRRYFRLDKGTLVWSKSDIAPPRGSLVLSGDDAVRAFAEVTDADSGTFSITTSDRVYELRAKTDPLAAPLWVEAINAVAGASGGDGEA